MMAMEGVRARAFVGDMTENHVKCDQARINRQTGDRHFPIFEKEHHSGSTLLQVLAILAPGWAPPAWKGREWGCQSSGAAKGCDARWR
jgi:hypothetical protein